MIRPNSTSKPLIHGDLTAAITRSMMQTSQLFTQNGWKCDAVHRRDYYNGPAEKWFMPSKVHLVLQNVRIVETVI